MGWDEFKKEPDPNEARLRQALAMLCEIHSRRMSDEAFQHWITRLLPHATTPAFWRAMEAACDDRSSFSIAWILEQRDIQARRDTKPYVAPPQLTELERHRSELARVKSIAWLHYVAGWSAEDFGGSVFMLDEARPVAEVLEEIKARYPRETIEKWMADQHAAGN